jgi:transposase
MKRIIIPKPTKFFTIEEKHELIRDYLQSDCTKDEIWRKYTGLADHGRLLNWMRDLGYIDIKSKKKSKIVTQSASVAKKKNISLHSESEFEMLRLKKRVQELEMQLKDAELKAIAYSTMVDIAEKEFKIPIRKKLNTKP